jgi:hypothetical protein
VLDSQTVAVIGWREWVVLPELGVGALKAKVDTGARTSALHAVQVEEYRRRGSPWVKFHIHPQTRTNGELIESAAPLVEYRQVRSSNGHLQLRPVIQTTIELLGQHWPIELTLTDRAEMGFRMLLGREALRGRFRIDPGASYLGGKKPKTDHERHIDTLRKRLSHR